jgi:hypothetical protein
MTEQRTSGNGLERLGSKLESITPGLNNLELDVQKLRAHAADIRSNGLTRDQLLDIYNRGLAVHNPILSHFLGYTGDRVEREGGDLRSFNRGITLAYHLIDGASEDGAPMMGVGSVKLASEYRNRPESFEALKIASDGILGSQRELSRAFDEALVGLPEGTDPSMARFGGGILVLGEMAAAKFGGTGVEAWFEPDEPQ